MEETKCYLPTHKKQFADTGPGTWADITEQLSISICHLLCISVTVLGYQMSLRPSVGVLGSNIITWGNICWDGKKVMRMKISSIYPGKSSSRIAIMKNISEGPRSRSCIFQCGAHHICATHTIGLKTHGMGRWWVKRKEVGIWSGVRHWVGGLSHRAGMGRQSLFWRNGGTLGFCKIALIILSFISNPTLPDLSDNC